MSRESRMVEKLFRKLSGRPKKPFPQEHQPLQAPTEQAVNVIRKSGAVLHVGRTLRGKKGLHQRLRNHLYGISSFAEKFLNGDGALLRKGCTYQYLVVKDARMRALLEAFAVGRLCPRHIGLGK